MKFKNKSLLKVAALSIVAAFSFGLAISCVSNHKQNINKVFAEDDISTTWSYNSNNKALSCTYASNYPNGFIMETNQVSVTGLGGGQYELAYNVLGYPRNAVEAEYTDYGTFTLTFISGSYSSTPSGDGLYGSIIACPLDISGLDSSTEYEIYLKVEPTGDMNDQNSGAGTTEPDGTWALSNGSLSFQYTDWQTNGYVTETNQTMVYGHGDGTFDIGYELLGSPPGATTAGTEFIADKTIQLTGGYWTPGDSGYGTVTGYPVDVNGLDSGTMITLNINVPYSGNMNEQGSGEGTDENAGTWTWNENTMQLSFQFSDTASAGYVSRTSQTMVYGHGNGTFDIGYDLYGTPAGATSASNDLLASKTIRLYDGYFNENTATVTGNSSEVAGLESYGQITVKVDVTPSGDLNTDGWRVNDGDLYFYVLDEVNPASIDSITWNNSSGNGTGEAILSVTISTSGGSFQQVYQINNPTFNPELEGTSGTTLGNTTVEGISEWSDRFVTIDISNKSYSLGESTQEVRYTITYYPNGADAEPANDSTEPVLEGEVSEYMLLHNMFDRPNYIFLGWGTDSSSQTPNYEEGEKVYLRSDTSYYAIWEYQEPEEIRYTITYYPNGAVGSSFQRYTDYVSGDSSEVNYTFERCPDDYHMEGYYFAGWSTSQGAEDVEYTAGEAYPVNRDLDVYAVWVLEEQEPETYEFEIIFVANDGTSETRTNSFTHYESSYTYDDLPSIEQIGFTREGYSFVGWSYDSDGEVLKEAPVIESGTTTFYAIWESISPQETEYTVKFNGNGATSGSMDDVTFTSSEENSYPYILPECGFSRDGYAFAGWGTTETASPELQPRDTTYIQPGETTFYAIWESTAPEETEYTVKFNGNGATSGSMDDDIFTSSQEYSYPYILPECGFSRDGYVFAGWGTTETTVIKRQPGETIDIQPGETTFYAIWTQVFTISFDANGGEGMMENITIPEGNATMPECSFTREGYSFAGWAVGSPTGDVYPTGASVYVSANYVLFATWEPITPITEIEISVAESEVVLYVDDSYIVQYTVTPEDAAGELIWKVEDEKVAAVIEDGMLVGLSTGSTTVTISDRSGNTSVSFVVYVVERPVPVQPENPISEETVEQINDAMDTMELTGGQIDRINEAINTNSDYLSDEAGSVIYEALLGTTINYDDPIVAEAQKELVVTVVETAVQVDAGKATSISDAQEIDKALPENANFSVEGEIDEFYQRQMYELFGGNIPTRHITRAGVPTYEINTDTDGKSGQEGADYLKDEQALYEKMVDFVDDSVDHMGKAALKLRKCSGESVTVSVKSYVTIVKVSSFREFDKEAADKEFVEACYKAILLSMQNQVISILEKEHKPSGNAEKEEQYKKELEAVKDIETFEIMVTEVLRQKYVALTGEQIDDVEDFQPIYWEIFKAWALDMPSPYPITLEELTQTTIEQSTGRAKAFTINSNLTAGEWGFIAGIAGGAVLIIGASAVVPTLLKKKKAKEGNK